MPPAASTGASPTEPQPPHILVVIPARYASTRLPGKPLADLAGRSMIEHVYRRALSAPGVDAVIVATDDARIVSAVTAFGGTAILTAASHVSGTDRLAEAVATRSCDIVVNVQGDEPLIAPEMIGEVVAPLQADPAVRMATLRRAIDSREEYLNPHVVKVVVSAAGDALYFSRAAIPFVRDAGEAAAAASAGTVSGTGGLAGSGTGVMAWKHIGIYAYRREVLLQLAALPRTPLETAESLEQLRALEHGIAIRTVATRHDAIGVDTPEDLERVRRRLQARAPSAGPSGGSGGVPTPAAASAHEGA